MVGAVQQEDDGSRGSETYAEKRNDFAPLERGRFRERRARSRKIRAKTPKDFLPPRFMSIYFSHPPQWGEDPSAFEGNGLCLVVWRRKWTSSRNCTASLSTQNYTPPGRREHSWHFVILDEMNRKDAEMASAEGVAICRDASHTNPKRERSFRLHPSLAFGSVCQSTRSPTNFPTNYPADSHARGADDSPRHTPRRCRAARRAQSRIDWTYWSMP